MVLCPIKYVWMISKSLYIAFNQLKQRLTRFSLSYVIFCHQVNAFKRHFISMQSIILSGAIASLSLHLVYVFLVSVNAV